MSKRKLRFNAIDALIILVIAAAVFVLLYVFVFSGRGTQTAAEVTTTTIRYVVELQNMDEHLQDAVKKGQLVEDAVERKKIGTVSGIQAVPFEKITFDYVNGRETTSSVEGKVTLKITIEAQAVETDRAFTVDGCEIRVGQQYSLILPDLYGYGYCTELIDN
ncbi:MAG: DUF4330 domain-containing protein [Clostridia bacterium]|nr:DUF4330 domain-containing protein [Oscillospiraceae bacterium]MBO4932626.1 DUF4330 domain-containing protein [Clostridia bacterium]MBO5128315.1 DUF4330 domain-containing protein [Clostridia bacterium]MBO5256306.1 DUF4330 domain-containing protein [Clostridia bacterium]